MKPKGTKGRPSTKQPQAQPVMIKQESQIPEEILHVTDFQPSENGMPSVDIVSCISYQKFRYSGENRPGKKYQDKDFMDLKLKNLEEKVVRIVIICTDADNKELIHPNGLVGKDCHDGIYDREYAVTDPDFIIKIPYLRTERIKTKKNECNKIIDILKNRAAHLPSPYRERCESQCVGQFTNERRFDTTKVCLGVIVTVKSHLQGAINGSLHAISHVVNNASEKTALGILRLSNTHFSARTGGKVDIFTTEDGPSIEVDQYVLSIRYEGPELHWVSDYYSPAKGDILYKRIISYQVPPFPHIDFEQKIEATLYLECPQSNQYCCCPIYYVSNEDYATSEKESQKRPLSRPESRPSKKLRQEGLSNSDAVKAGLKEVVIRRQEEMTDLRSVLSRSDAHTVQEMVYQEVTDNFQSSRRRTNQSNLSNLKVVATGYSNSVPSNTVVIITEGDNPEDIDIANAINKSVSYFDKRNAAGDSESNQPIVILNSSQEISAVPNLRLLPKVNKSPATLSETKSSDSEDQQTKDNSSRTSPKSQNHILQVRTDNAVPKSIPSKILSNHVKPKRTESPWAVDSDTESIIDLNIFKNVVYDRVDADKKSQQTCKTIVSANSSSDDHIVHVGSQKTLTVLKSSLETVNKELISSMSLPSEILNLNSELIADYDMVKEVNKEYCDKD